MNKKLKMRLVLDNTVMSNFALIGCTNWLESLWPGLLVTPDDAWVELEMGINLGLIPKIDWSWLKVLPLTTAESKLRDEFIPPLDKGEAACLALAYTRSYVLFTDDRTARREARRRGVSLSGTIGLLQALVEEEYITFEQADEALKQMIVLGYRSPMESLDDLR